jgi:hypothetical protein
MVQTSGRAVYISESKSALARMSSKFVLARIKLLCHDAVMANTLTITEFARMGGKALAKKMTAKQRKESARKAAQARWAKTKKTSEK